MEKAQIVYELAQKLMRLKAEERSLLNKLDDIRRKILTIEIEIYQTIEPTDCPFCGKPVKEEERLNGTHLCDGLKKALQIIQGREHDEVSG